MSINYYITYTRNDGTLIYPYQGSYAGPDNMNSIRENINNYLNMQLIGSDITFDGTTLQENPIEWANVRFTHTDSNGNQTIDNNYIRYNFNDQRGDWSKIGPGAALPFPSLAFEDLT